MDAVTHALVGATLSRLPPGDALAPRRRLLLGAAAAMFPDLDFVAFPLDPLRFLADWHQGPTHSLLLLPGWAALLAGLGCVWLGRRAFAEAYAVAALGLASHAALDVVTAYGTQLLHPLSDHRFALGLAWVIDPLFTALAALGLLASVRRGRQGVAFGLALLALYVALLGWLQQRALALAARSLPAAERVAALAQPFSPFNWKLIALHGDDYAIAHVNLAGHRPLLPRGLEPWGAAAHAYAAPRAWRWQQRRRFSDDPDALARGLWQRPDFAPFRRFAEYPALLRIDDDGERRCVWFSDLRYDLPAMPATFRYGFCAARPGEPWRLHRLRYFNDERQALH